MSSDLSFIGGMSVMCAWHYDCSPLLSYKPACAELHV